VTTDKDRVLRGGWREIKLYVQVKRLSGIEKFKGKRENLRSLKCQLPKKQPRPATLKCHSKRTECVRRSKKSV